MLEKEFRKTIILTVLLFVSILGGVSSVKIGALNRAMVNKTVGSFNSGSNKALSTEMSTNLSTSLVSWWPLDGNTTDVQDGNTGTVEGTGGQFVPAKTNLGFQSGGPGSLVKVNDSSNLDVPRFSIDVWVKITALNPSMYNMPIVWKGDSLGHELTTSYSITVYANPGSFNHPGPFISGTPASGKMFFIVANSTAEQVLITKWPLPTGIFVNIAAIADGSKMRIYINGQLDTEADQIVKPQNSTFPFQIGGEDSGAGFFNGVIDEVKFYNRALTSQEMTTFASDSWPMFHHDPAHTGYSTSTAPNTNQTLWNASVGAMVYITDNLAVANGIVFEGEGYGTVHAFNATTGATVWTFQAGIEVKDTPVIANGVVYITGAIHIWGDILFALNATNGAQIWNVTTSGGMECPVVADGKLFINFNERYILALNATTGASIWEFDRASVTTEYGVISYLTVADGRVYMGLYSNYGGGALAVNATNGAFIWVNYVACHSMDYPALTFADGRIFMGTENTGGSNATVYALNATTGANIWSYSGNDYAFTSPIVTNGKVYVGGALGVYALNSTNGALTWFAPIGYWNNNERSSAAVADGKIFIGVDGSLFALNASTGAVVWKYYGDTFDSSPAVAYGKLYERGYYKVYAFGSPDVSAVGSVMGITGYKLVFNETVSNSLVVPTTFDYYWSFSADKWDGTQWVASGISGSTAPVMGYSIPALATVDLPYTVYALSPTAVAWGDWLRISYTYHWTYAGLNYSTSYTTKLHVHPGDIAGAVVSFPYFGADGICDISDAAPIGVNWQKLVPPSADPTSLLARSDITGDGIVDISDAAIVGVNWQKTWTNNPPA